MQILIKTFLILVFPFIGWSQISFYKLYSNNGYDFGQGAVQLEDSSYIITGSSSSFSETNSSQAYLLKIDSLGQNIWSKNYGGIETDWGRRVLYSKNDALYVSGFTNSIGNGGYDFYLIKTDLSGNLIWEKSYGGSGWEKVNDAVLLPDTSILMVGETNSGTLGNKDIYLVKTDKNGDTLWTKQIGTSGEDFATSIRLLNDSICVIGGQIYNADSLMTKAYLLKLNVNGTIIWEHQYGKHGNTIFKDLCLVGNHINAIGHKQNIVTGKIDPICSKIFLNGNEDYLFEDILTGDYYYELVTTYAQTNKLYFALNSSVPGSTYSEGLDLSIARFTESLLWDNHSVNVSNVGDDIAGQLIPTNDGGVLMVGYNTHFGAGGNNVFAFKIGADEVFPNTTNNPTVSPLVELIELENESISYFPNPVSDYLTIQLPENWSGKVYLTDLLGKQLFEQENSTQIELNDYSNGNYILTFRNSKGSKLSKIITINH